MLKFFDNPAVKAVMFIGCLCGLAATAAIGVTTPVVWASLIFATAKAGFDIVWDMVESKNKSPSSESSTKSQPVERSSLPSLDISQNITPDNTPNVSKSNTRQR